MADLILSLTTDNIYIIVFPGFWMYYPMIHKQELLMTEMLTANSEFSDHGGR